MANRLVYPKTGALLTAGAIQAMLALSKLKLFRTDIPVNANTLKADLVAAEADFDGYAAITVTAWKDPYLDPSGGASTDSGEQIFYYVDGVSHVANAIFGFWCELAAGDVVVIGQFVDDAGMPTPVNMAGNGDAVPLTVRLIFGANP